MVRRETERIAALLMAADRHGNLSSLEELQHGGDALPVIVIADLNAEPDMVERALRLSAFDVLDKCCSDERLAQVIESLLRLTRFHRVTRQALRQIPASTERRFDLIHHGAAMRKLLTEVDRVAESEARVCIFGETGVGKELIARAVHERSKQHPLRWR